MDLEDVLTRIESRLKALGLSAHAASLAAKKPDAIRNLQRAVRSGDRRGVTTETLMALAPVLKTTAAWLLEGVGESTPGNRVRVWGGLALAPRFSPNSSKSRPTVSMRSRCRFQSPQTPSPFRSRATACGRATIRGMSIICWRQGANADQVVGWEAAVRTADGKRYLKRI